MWLAKGGTKPKIMVVEDEAVVATYLARVLQKLGYDVAGVADNGEDALLMATSLRPDLVLMDIVIQGPSDGIETASEIHKRIDVPVIFLTAHSDDQTIRRAQQGGGVGYLVKPVEERALHATIEMALYRHRAEAHARLLAQALSTSSTGIAIVDARSPDMRFVTCNAALERMSGYSAAEILERKPCFLDGPTTDPVSAAEVRSALSETRETRVTISLHRKDGTPFWDELVISPTRNAVGELTHFLFFHTDVTARKSAEAALSQVQKMEALSRLTGGIAHDFNNLLGVITVFAGFVRDELEDGDPRRDDVVEVLHAANRAADLTRQLLTFSRTAPGSRRHVEVNDAVAKLGKILRRCVGENIDIEIDPCPEPATIQIDPVKLDQVLMNLAVNARDAMPSGGHLRIATERREGRVRIVVSDDGCGMDAATKARVFEPFFTTKGVGAGTGLGLATCFAIVTDADGTVQVESAVGRGATFVVELPECHDRAGSFTDEHTPDSGRMMVSPESLRGSRVLVVEDDPALRRATLRILESAGYDVTTAEHGDAAILRLGEGTSEFDVVVSDVVMPGCGGFALREYVRRESPRTAVLLTSGYSRDRARDGGEVEDAEILRKPYTDVELLDAVRAALTMRRRPPPESVRRRPGSTVLVVDDDPATRAAVKRVLASAGYDVTLAEGVGDGKRLALEQRSFDAVICDLSLRDGSGADFVAWLRTEIPELLPRTLILTGGATDEAGRRLVASNRLKVLRKPLSPGELLAGVAASCAHVVRSSIAPEPLVSA